MAKRLSDEKEPEAKHPRLESQSESAQQADLELEKELAEKEEDFFDLLEDVPLAGDDLDHEEQVEEPPEELARRQFAEELAAQFLLSPERLSSLIRTLEGQAPQWGPVRRWQSVALLCAYVARSKRETRTAFVSTGMPLLGSLLSASMEALEGTDVSQRQKAADWAIACLACLRMLSIGRATMWEHRQSVGKVFDRLHRWCDTQKSHIAAEIRAPMEALCRRWRSQPKPAAQDKEGGVQRQRVVVMLAHAVSGVVQDESLLPPLSPSPSTDVVLLASPSPCSASHLLPCKTAAAEIEVELYKHSGGLTAEYKQHARMLRTNLAKPANSALRERVLSGELSPAELVNMRSEDLAPEALQQQRKQVMKQAMAKVIDKQGLGGPPKSPFRGDDEARNYDMNMAPPPLSPIPEDEGEADKEDDVANSLPTPGPMLPPPTPFRMPEEITSSAAKDSPEKHAAPPDIPDFIPTPAPEEEDEVTALIRRLSGRP